MTEGDTEDAWAAGQAAFEARGEHWPASTESPAVRWRHGVKRLLHVLATDPGGAWVATDGRRIRGIAMAIVREGVWGLSLFAVDPEAQGDGVGKALLDRALEHGDGTRGQIIMSSQDPRALRIYARAGFRLLPALAAFGPVDPDGLEPEVPVRAGTEADLEMAALVDREVRGGAHGEDLVQLIGAGSRFHVVPDRGYVVHGDGSPRLLAALDDEAARSLLAAALQHAPQGLEAGVQSLTAEQGWAIDVALAAGMALETSGPTAVRGEPGPLAPYLPNPAFL